MFINNWPLHIADITRKTENIWMDCIFLFLFFLSVYLYLFFSDNDFLNEDQSVLVSHGGSPVLLFAAMRIANWRKLWGSVNWETVENCWELWKLVRIVGTCRVGWIKKRKQWSIYFQPLRVHTGRFFVFIILWQPLSFFCKSLEHWYPWVFVCLLRCDLMRGRFWKSAQSLPHILISGWSGPYEYVHTPTTVHIRTHMYTWTLLLSYGCDSSVGRWSSSDKMGSWPYFTFGWWLSLYLCVYPNMYFCVASTLYLVGAQFKVISQGDRISGRTHMELMKLPFASGKWFMWPTNWILHQLYF